MKKLLSFLLVFTLLLGTIPSSFANLSRNNIRELRKEMRELQQQLRDRTQKKTSSERRMLIRRLRNIRILLRKPKKTPEQSQQTPATPQTSDSSDSSASSASTQSEAIVSKSDSPAERRKRRRRIRPVRIKKEQERNTTEVRQDEVLYSERGIASYYAGKFHGRKTASGDIYDMHLMTAAHKTLPFGTIVRVTNLDNGKNIIVVINDRGPYVDGRIIDLSWKAFGILAPHGSGLIRRALVEVMSEGNQDYQRF